MPSGVIGNYLIIYINKLIEFYVQLHKFDIIVGVYKFHICQSMYQNINPGCKYLL